MTAEPASHVWSPEPAADSAEELVPSTPFEITPPSRGIAP